MTLNREADISLKQYENAGGLKGAIDQDAENVFGQFPGEETEIKRVFQRITEKGDGEKPIRKPEAIPVLAEITGLCMTRLSKILAAFAERDLLVMRKVEGEEIQVDLPHECLGSKWERLRGWIEDEAAVAKSLEFMRESAKKAQLLTGSVLAEARQLREQGRLDGLWPCRYLSEKDLVEVKSWVNESEEQEQKKLETEVRARQRRATILVTIGLLAVGLAVLFGLLYRRAEQQARIATSRQLAAHAISELWLNPKSGTKDVLDALAISETYEAQQALDETLSQSSVMVVLQDPDRSPVVAAAFSRSGHYLMTSTSSSKVWLWDLASSKALRSFESGSGYRISSDSLSSDSKYLLTAYNDGEFTVRVYDTATGAALGSFVASTVGGITSATFSPSGKYIATTGADYTAAIWDATAIIHKVLSSGYSQPVASIEPLKRRKLHKDIVNSIRFSNNDQYVVTAGQDGRAEVWDWRSGRQAELRRYTTALFSAEFHPKNAHIVLTGGQDGNATLWTWTMEGGFSAHLQNLQWHKLDVRQASFNSGGTWVLTASTDGTASVWNLAEKTPKHPTYILSGHRGAVTTAAFGLDERSIATASVDGTARIWVAKPVPDFKSLREKIEYLKQVQSMRSQKPLN
ncbi:MAG TPA: WD40 repeat domain-containing protein [Candidatus Angelobacter sp.]|jgi:WD40 repeat protein|nr:WD40 repeat domain-containing protein [Candidatus Angelobacter sp.]